MHFASIGSGSKGNGTVVRADECTLLIDCGFSALEAEKRLEKLGILPQELTAILVTHEHSDHVRGVAGLARKYSIPVYASHGTYHAEASLHTLKDIHTFDSHRDTFWINDIAVTPIAVPHDAREPTQYIFYDGKHRLGVLTDIGSIPPYIIEQYENCDSLLLEYNHDVAMLQNGPYPPSLKQRVGGNWGHLSNLQASQFLAAIDHERLQHLVIAHISEKNNRQELALACVRDVFSYSERVTMADQQDGFAWLALA